MKHKEMLAFTAILCYVVLPPIIESTKSCCDNGVLMLNESMCENNKTTSLSCEDFISSLSNDDLSPYNHYNIFNDTEGEYLKPFDRNFKVQAPNFCEGTIKKPGRNKTQLLAAYCLNAAVWFNDEPVSWRYSIIDFYTLLLLLLTILNFVTFVLLMVTALLYFFLPEVQDVDGVCTFHFTLNVGLLHGIFIYKNLLNNTMLPDLCITELYVGVFIVLSAFAWFAVLSFNMWYKFRKTRLVIDESKLLRRYRFFAYGMPAFLVAIANIAAHASSLYTKYQFETLCYRHQSVLLFFVLICPILATMVANLLFYIFLQANLRNYLPADLQGKRFGLRQMRYRILLLGKLFLIMGLPWILLVIFAILTLFYRASLIVFCIFCILLLFISSEGVYIFLILVVFRRQVRKAVLNRYMPNCRYVPASWRTENDVETSQESCCSNESNQQDQNGGPATTNHDTSLNFISLHT